MKTLQANEIKKGDTVYLFGAWNFHFNCERDDHFHRDERGRCVWTKRTVDEMFIQKHIVHSCGKKRMYLMAEDGHSRGREYRVYFNNRDQWSFGYFARTHQDAVDSLNELIAKDEYSKHPFTIIEKN